MTGVIYCYTCTVNNKRYIGQTMHEAARKAHFNYLSNVYSKPNSKFDNARHKYGLESFVYEILEKYENDDKDALIKILNEREIYYINLYDTFKNGYNSTTGGRGNYPKVKPGRKLSEETKRKIGERNKISQKNRVYTAEEKEKAATLVREIFNKKVLQYDLDGNFIKEWESITIAGEYLKISRTSISDCWNRNKKSCQGYIWKLKDGESIPLKIEGLSECDKEEELRKMHAVNNGIAKYTLNGELICVYTSLAQAARDVGKESDRYYIRKCCRNELDQFKNFKFKYYDLR